MADAAIAAARAEPALVLLLRRARLGQRDKLSPATPCSRSCPHAAQQQSHGVRPSLAAQHGVAVFARGQAPPPGEPQGAAKRPLVARTRAQPRRSPCRQRSLANRSLAQSSQPLAPVLAGASSRSLSSLVLSRPSVAPLLPSPLQAPASHHLLKIQGRNPMAGFPSLLA
jgi:hypothetical protein